MKKKYIDHLVPINNVCNQKCIFCSAEYRMKGNPPIPLKTIFKQILEKDNYIQISGGEPLLSDKLFEILYFIRKKKPTCFIELQTNGIYLLNNNNLTKLQKFNINLYNVNYPCHIEEINDKIVGIKGTLKLREEGMKEIIKRGLNLRINIIVNKLNYKYLPSMVDYINIHFKGLERIQFSFVKAMGAADKNIEVVPRYEDTKKYFISALRKCEEYNIKADVDHIPLCFLGEYYKCHVDYNKLLNNENGVFLEEKIYIGKCKECNIRKFCSGYRKDYLNIYPYINDKTGYN